MFNSLIQILRPVSPLAWFPIGLALFQNSEKASIFTIAITSIWPTLINTAYGASTIPQDFKNVSKVFGFSILNYFRYVVVPYTFSFTLTGLKISIGIAWMVIVASVINLRNVMSAIILIGVIGYILDYSFSYLQRRFQR
jgi:nitrate/nitrite transport system permease protein